MTWDHTTLIGMDASRIRPLISNYLSLKGHRRPRGFEGRRRLRSAGSGQRNAAWIGWSPALACHSTPA